MPSAPVHPIKSVAGSDARIRVCHWSQSVADTPVVAARSAADLHGCRLDADQYVAAHICEFCAPQRGRQNGEGPQPGPQDGRLWT